MKRKNTGRIGGLMVYLFPFFCYSQSDYKIEFKDYHSVDIAVIKLTRDKNHIITSDNDGKVLMFDAKNFDFVKTIKPSGNIPISGLQPVRDDSLLLMSQRYQTSFKPEFDSLLLKNLHLETVPVFKQQSSFRVIDLGVENHFGVLSSEQFQYVFTLFNNNAKSIVSVDISGLIHQDIIAVSHDLEMFSYLSLSGGISKKEIKSFNLKSNAYLNNLTVPENKDVISLFFDRQSHSLFAVTAEKDSEIVIYNLSSGSFDSPVYSVKHPVTPFDKVIHDYDKGQHIITIANGLVPVKPLVIFANKNTFSHHIVNLPNGATHAVVNTEKKEIIFVNRDFHKNIKDLSVYNYVSGSVTGSFPKVADDFYTSVFFPDNSWIAYTNRYGEDIVNQEIKYFETGTFHNRFGALSFKNYLETKHGVTAYSGRVFKEKGMAVIYGNDTKSYRLDHYYVYEFAQDRITKITDTKLNRIVLQDYNSERNMLLLGNDTYTNQGYTESVKLEMVSQNKITPIQGDYKFGKFSADGNYLLTINKNNLVEIKKTADLKIIFSKSLVEGNYSLHSAENSTFIVSIDHRILKENECNRESFFLEIKNNEVNLTEAPCAFINDVGYVNNNFGYIVDNYGLGINGGIIPFPKSHFPRTFSFNKDASGFMVSFNDGKTAIYRTETLKPSGYMMHPNSKSHLFYDTSYNYFSNVDAGQFLTATKNGQKIPLSQVESLFFNPGKILELFGSPNQNYLAALQKALRLRKDDSSIDNNIDYESSVYNPALTENIPDSKPNLYLLSIGVSDYQDHSRSLTFSDKDAVDMAKIYGNLSSEQIRAYNDRFFGTKYKLYNQNSEALGTIHHYSGIYKRIGNKYLLNTEGDIWLDEENKRYTIWNFKNGSVDSLNIPELEHLGFTSDIGELIFVKPDNTGFYLKGKSNLFEYSFNAKKFIPAILPFEAEKGNFIPLKDNQWLHFEDHIDSLNITIGKTGSDKMEKSFSLRFQNSGKIFKNVAADGTVSTDTLFSSFKTFKTASSDGRYVFYIMGTDDLFLLDLQEKNIIPTRLPVSMGGKYGCEISVDSEKKQFYILETLYDLDEEHIRFYDFKGKLSDSLKFRRHFKNNGSVNNGKSYYYIEVEESLLSKNYFNNTEEVVLERSSPHSFDKVFTEFMINQNADSKSITQQLQTYFLKASPDDQIILFLAGHGVLDSKNNYFFAPYDMDFEEVKKSGISFESIVQSLQKSPAKNKLLLMDTCHSGKTIDLENNSEKSMNRENQNKGERGSQVISGSAPKYKVSDIVSTLFEDFLSKSGVTILSASSGGDLAQEHPDWGNGAFTSSYIKTMKSKMGGTIMLDAKGTKVSIPLDESFINDLYKEVVNLTKGKQVPDLRELNKKVKISVW